MNFNFEGVFDADEMVAIKKYLPDFYNKSDDFSAEVLNCSRFFDRIEIVNPQKEHFCYKVGCHEDLRIIKPIIEKNLLTKGNRDEDSDAT